MRALSIPQPWAELVIRGVKTVEVRSWYAKHGGGGWHGWRIAYIVMQPGSDSMFCDEMLQVIRCQLMAHMIKSYHI